MATNVFRDKTEKMVTKQIGLHISHVGSSVHMTNYIGPDVDIRPQVPGFQKHNPKFCAHILLLSIEDAFVFFMNCLTKSLHFSARNIFT